jgi:hypothetical protein
MLHQADMPANEAMEELSNALRANSSFGDGRASLLVDRLRKLVVAPPGLALQFKAQQLVTFTGTELDDFRFICDIRPVIDGARTQVEGLIPLTVLRIEYSLPDGEDSVIELRVTRRQLRDFSLKAKDAEAKLALLERLVMAQGIEIPRINATIAPED